MFCCFHEAIRLSGVKCNYYSRWFRRESAAFEGRGDTYATLRLSHKVLPNPESEMNGKSETEGWMIEKERERDRGRESRKETERVVDRDGELSPIWVVIKAATEPASRLWWPSSSPHVLTPPSIPLFIFSLHPLPLHPLLCHSPLCVHSILTP